MNMQKWKLKNDKFGNFLECLKQNGEFSRPEREPRTSQKLNSFQKTRSFKKPLALRVGLQRFVVLYFPLGRRYCFLLHETYPQTLIIKNPPIQNQAKESLIFEYIVTTPRRDRQDIIFV